MNERRKKPTLVVIYSDDEKAEELRKAIVKTCDEFGVDIRVKKGEYKNEIAMHLEFDHPTGILIAADEAFMRMQAGRRCSGVLDIASPMMPPRIPDRQIVLVGSGSSLCSSLIKSLDKEMLKASKPFVIESRNPVDFDMYTVKQEKRGKTYPVLSKKGRRIEQRRLGKINNRR